MTNEDEYTNKYTNENIGYFTKKLISLMKLYIRRNNSILPNNPVLIHKEDMEKCKELYK